MATGTNASTVQVACTSESQLALNPMAMTEERGNPTGVIMMAAGCGLATGLLEVVILACRWLYNPTTGLGDRWVNRHYLWMIPVSNMLIFAACGLLISLGTRIWPKRGGRLAAYLFCGLAALDLLLEMPGLRMPIYFLMACGIAALFGPVFEARTRHVRLDARDVVPLLVATVAALGCISHGRELLTERSALAHLPTAASDAPNVLLIGMGAVHADATSPDDYDRDGSSEPAQPGPEGARFQQASATGPGAFHAIANIFTRIFPDELGVSTQCAPDGKYPTLAEMFGARGYETAGFVADPTDCHVDLGAYRGFVHYQGVPVSAYEVFRSGVLGECLVEVFDRSLCKLCEALGDQSLISSCFGNDHRATPRKSSSRCAARINRDALDWMSARRQPFFAYLNYEDGGAYLGDQVGRLFDELDTRGLLENTVVMLAADDGEHAGKFCYMFDWPTSGSHKVHAKPPRPTSCAPMR